LDTQTDSQGLNVINLLDLPGGLGCDAFPNQGAYDEYLWKQPGSRYACAWDYPRARILTQPVETLNLISNFTMTLNNDMEWFNEIVASQVTSNKIFEPIQIGTSLRDASGNRTTKHWYPNTGSANNGIVDSLSQYFGAQQLNVGAPIAYRWRCIECGPREIETKTTAKRFLTGLRGSFGDWDWETSLSYATSEGKSHLVNGYYFDRGIISALGSGALNPFLLPDEKQSHLNFGFGCGTHPL
jgi:iron complex outermembrane receptor protein